MQSYITDLNLVDLISEKHAKLRKMVRDKWVEAGEEYITDTESYMLALLERESMTVAQLARKIDISRQGAHKCAKGLISRDYILVENIEGNSRDKALILTDKGHRFCEETLIIKKKIENDIKNSIGEDELELLRKYLSKTWFK